MGQNSCNHAFCNVFPAKIISSHLTGNVFSIKYPYRASEYVKDFMSIISATYVYYIILFVCRLVYSLKIQLSGIAISLTNKENAALHHLTRN
jgi:hypothetical protein